MEIMQQLFWRLNNQENRNKKHKAKKKRARMLNGIDASHDRGIDSDIAGAVSASRDSVETPGTTRYEITS
jgi:hypothetical protein